MEGCECILDEIDYARSVDRRSIPIVLTTREAAPRGFTVVFEPGNPLVRMVCEVKRSR